MKWLLLVLIALLIVYPWLARMRARGVMAGGSRSIDHRPCLSLSMALLRALALAALEIFQR